MAEIGEASHSWEMARKPYKIDVPQQHDNNFIRERRLKLGFTLEIMEAKTGLDKSTISKIESGGRNGRASSFKKIAHALGVKRWQDLFQPMSEAEENAIAAAVVKTLRERKAGAR